MSQMGTKKGVPHRNSLKKIGGDLIYSTAVIKSNHNPSVFCQAFA